MSKLSEARIRNTKTWDDYNRERKRYINNRSTARNFIKSMNRDDIPEFEKLIKERKEKLD